MPAVGVVKGAAEGALLARQQAFLLERIVSIAEHVRSLGAGTSMTLSVYCAENATLSWSDGHAILAYGSEEITRSSDELPGLEIPKGQLRLAVANDGAVKIAVIG